MADDIVFEKIFVDQKSAVEELKRKIEQVSEVFVIERETGKIIFKNYENLNDSQRVAIILLGKHIAKKSGLNITESLGPSEIGKELGKSRTSISGPLTKLNTLRLLEISDGKYSVNPHMITKILDFIKGGS
jgi:hypothetical protein